MDRDTGPPRQTHAWRILEIRPPSSLNASIPERSTAEALRIARPAVSADRSIRADYKPASERPTIGDLGGSHRRGWRGVLPGIPQAFAWPGRDRRTALFASLPYAAWDDRERLLLEEMPCRPRFRAPSQMPRH